MVWAVLNEDQSNALREIQNSDSDRVTAILGGALLDDSLRQTLTYRFRPGSTNDKLFKVSGALGNLGPKIALAYQLYMIEKPMREAMYGINEIRNLFAHDLSMTFSSTDKRMIGAIEKLKTHEGMINYPTPYFAPDDKIYETSIYKIESVADPRSQFTVNLKISLMWLMGDLSRHMPYSNIWQENPSQRAPR